MMALFAQSAVRSILLSLFVAACLYVAQTRSAHLRKAIWASVLLASLAMPLLLITPLPRAISAPAILMQFAPSSELAENPRFDWARLIAFAYWIGFGALAIRYVIAMTKIAMVRRSAQRLQETWAAKADIRVTPLLGVPATFGATILLPDGYEQWSTAKRNAVIAHECSHVAEHDCYLLWLARVNTCLFWFNPMAWVIQRRIAALAEETSDDAAIRAVESPPVYAEILLEFASLSYRASSVIAPMAQAAISRRIKRIIDQTTTPKRPTMKRRLLAISAVLPAVICAALPLRPITGVARADVPSTASAQDPGQLPRITDYGGLVHLSSYYPKDAQSLGIEGRVELAVTLDAEGRATNTLIVSENPQNLGFGAAASAAAHTMQYSNPTGRPVTFNFQLQFALR